MPQSITYTAIGDHFYGEPPITLQASRSSGLPLEVTIEGPATFHAVDSTISLDDIGYVIISLYQPGNEEYALSDRVIYSLRVREELLLALKIILITDSTFRLEQKVM